MSSSGGPALRHFLPRPSNALRLPEHFAKGAEIFLLRESHCHDPSLFPAGNVAIWSPETKFRIWFEIEAHACDALAEIGVIPKEAAKTIWEKGGAAQFDVARIDEIEAVTKHDVIAFLTHLAEFVGPDSRFIHQGMTSSDVLDTTLNIQLVRAADLLIADMDRVLAALKTRAFEHKDTVRIGRSHGIHAEPTTMGLTFARFYAEMDRNRARLVNARAEIATGAIFRRCRYLRQYRSICRRTRLPGAWPVAGACLDAGHSP